MGVLLRHARRARGPSVRGRLRFHVDRGYVAHRLGGTRAATAHPSGPGGPSRCNSDGLGRKQEGSRGTCTGLGCLSGSRAPHKFCDCLMCDPELGRQRSNPLTRTVEPDDLALFAEERPGSGSCGPRCATLVTVVRPPRRYALRRPGAKAPHGPQVQDRQRAGRSRWPEVRTTRRHRRSTCGCGQQSPHMGGEGSSVPTTQPTCVRGGQVFVAV